MSAALNELLLAALKRSGKPLASDELLDQAVGLGLNEGWTPQTLRLNRKSIGRRLTLMEEAGHVRVVAQKRDPVSRRDTPTYEPSEGWDPNASVPSPDSEAERQGTSTRSVYSDMTPRQRLAVFESHDIMLEGMARMLTHLQAGVADMMQSRERARQRLLAEGLEVG